MINAGYQQDLLSSLKLTDFSDLGSIAVILVILFFPMTV